MNSYGQNYLNEMKKQMERGPLVYVDGDDIVIKEHNYRIPLFRRRTHEAMVFWIKHLIVSKRWITTEHIESFIYVACEANGMKLPDA